MCNLHAELHRANLHSRNRMVDGLLATLVSPKLRTVVGIDHVEIYDGHYTPLAGGSFGLIIGVVEFGDLVDLAALDLDSERIGTRLGVGRALGHDALDYARHNGTTVYLRERVVDWLHEPDAAAFILDWSLAGPLLGADIGDWRLRCASWDLAHVVAKVLDRPLPRPRIEVQR
jgi:hypothetical protein